MPVLPYAEIASPQLLDLVAYWSSRSGDGGVPARSAFDPVDIPALLPALSLVELIGESRQARFRVYGTEIVRNFGYDLTGKTLEEADISAERVRYWQEIYWRVADTALPLFGRDNAIIRHYVSFEWVKLPMTGDSGAIDVILCGYDFVGRD